MCIFLRYFNLLLFPYTHITRNEWQSLAYSPLGATVLPPASSSKITVLPLSTRR